MKPEGEKGRKMKTFELLSRDYTLFLLVFFLLSFFFLSSFIPLSLFLSLFLSLSVFCFSFVSLFPFRGKKTKRFVFDVFPFCYERIDSLQIGDITNIREFKKKEKTLRKLIERLLNRFIFHIWILKKKGIILISFLKFPI